MAITLAKDRSTTTLSLPYGSATLLADALPPVLDPALMSGPGPATDRLCAARVRLLNSLPQVSIAWSLWCGKCGTLRDGLGGGGPVRSSKKRKTFEDELEAELHAALAAMDDPPRNRSACAVCGSAYRRPRPTPSFFASARTVARTRRASRLAAEVTPDEPAPREPTKAEQALAVPPAERGKAALTRTPSLAHIPGADPGTPTYPPPSASSGASVNPAPPSPPPSKKRKTKKSGLAKLLAQNKAREAEKSSGNWGLG